MQHPCAQQVELCATRYRDHTWQVMAHDKVQKTPSSAAYSSVLALSVHDRSAADAALKCALRGG
jgi:hypothetical protein